MALQFRVEDAAMSSHLFSKGFRWPLLDIKRVKSKPIFDVEPPKLDGELIMNEQMNSRLSDPSAKWANAAIRSISSKVSPSSKAYFDLLPKQKN
jgi:hypothetical protein